MAAIGRNQPRNDGKLPRKTRLWTLVNTNIVELGSTTTSC